MKIIFHLQQPLDVTNHSVAREVVTFFTLPPGDYIVVPQTNVPNCDGKFLLRILTDEQSNIWEVNEDNVLFRNVLVEFEESFKYVSFVPIFIKRVHVKKTWRKTNGLRK